MTKWTLPPESQFFVPTEEAKIRAYRAFNRGVWLGAVLGILAFAAVDLAMVGWGF